MIRDTVECERWCLPGGDEVVLVVPSGHPGCHLVISEDPTDHDVTLVNEVQLAEMRRTWQDMLVQVDVRERTRYEKLVDYPHGDELTDADRAWAAEVVRGDSTIENGYYDLLLLGAKLPHQGSEVRKILPPRRVLDSEHLIK